MSNVTYDQATLSALDTLLAHDARFVRLLFDEARSSLGDEGVDEVDRALLLYGRWLARSILSRWPTDSPDLAHVLQHWDLGELPVGPQTGWATLDVSGGPRLAIADSPAVRHFVQHGEPALISRYYGQLFTGVAHACDEAEPRVSAADDHLELLWSGRPTETVVEADQGTDAAQLLLHTAQGRGALMALTGQSLIKRFATTGEFVLRRAMSRFGAERGEILREGVDSKGLAPNILNMISNYDSGGHAAVWQWAPGGELSPSRQFQDCVFCPFIPVWRDLDAMDIGRIYDFEFHTAQFHAFNPAIRLRWDALQTAGDDHCAFRFTLPDA